MVKIVTIPHPALRKVSKEVSKNEIGSSEFKKFLDDMTVALKTRDDGVGLSAPQIAVNQRVFVVSGKVFRARSGEDRDSQKVFADEYFINPVITKFSKKLAEAEEGCLSIPNTYGMVKRPNAVTMEYMNPQGEKMSKKATGLLARIFQHEIDHLDGILFTDKATAIKQAKDTNDNQEL